MCVFCASSPTRMKIIPTRKSRAWLKSSPKSGWTCRPCAAPDWAGPCDFLDVESGRRDARHIDGGVLRRYRAAYDAHFEMWKEQARRFRTPLARISSMGSLETALSAGALSAGALETF